MALSVPLIFCSFRDQVGDTTKNLIEIGSEPPVHPIVNDGVDTGVGHGQPVEAKVDVADITIAGDGGIVVAVDEVDVIRGPAHHEDHHHEGEHLDNLLLVIPALGEGGLWDQQPQGGLVSVPEMSAHLDVADSHYYHGHQVGQEEEEDVVPSTEKNVEYCGTKGT